MLVVEGQQVLYRSGTDFTSPDLLSMISKAQTGLEESENPLKNINMNFFNNNQTPKEPKDDKEPEKKVDIAKLADQAVSENRMITPEEGQIRMNAGYAMLATTLGICALYPPARTAYGYLGFAAATAVGTWRTGKQSL